MVLPTQDTRVEENHKKFLCTVSWSVHHTTWLVMVTLSPPVAVSKQDFYSVETKIFFPAGSGLTNSALVYEPKCGGTVNEYCCVHGAQINFGDLTPYLTDG
jgi:hypothetical protein